jgi:nucleoid-associated protein EbfC
MAELDKLMQQAKKMQENIQKAQEELTKMVVVGRAGGDQVRVAMTGVHFVKKVAVDPSLLKESEKAMLEDLIAVAVNDAVQKIEKGSRTKMAELMSGIDVPPGFMPGESQGDAEF